MFITKKILNAANFIYWKLQVLFKPFILTITEFIVMLLTQINFKCHCTVYCTSELCCPLSLLNFNPWWFRFWT